MTATEALLVVTALHAGFQLVVSVVVYPALADVPAGLWASAHAAHSRRITWVVAPLYAAVLAACAWALLAVPLSPGTAVALAGSALALGTTALVAAPTHGRLGSEGKRPELVRRLLVADRVRTVGAVLALLGTMAA